MCGASNLFPLFTLDSVLPTVLLSFSEWKERTYLTSVLLVIMPKSSFFQRSYKGTPNLSVVDLPKLFVWFVLYCINDLAC